MLVEPGFFRTELLTQDSTRYAEPPVEDWAQRTRQTVTALNGMVDVARRAGISTG